MSLKRIAGAAIALTAAACSLLVHGSGVQCMVDQDCVARGFDSGGQPMVCSKDNVCVGPGVGGPCATNAECIARSGNAPAICRKDNQTCQPLLSAECSQVYGDPTNDDAIVLGGVF